MKLAILIGPHAVGKMTVGQHLSELSGYKLFHNHLTIELVAPLFSFSTPEGRGLVNDIRQLFFEAFAKSDAAGYILTFVWALNSQVNANTLKASLKYSRIRDTKSIGSDSRQTLKRVLTAIKAKTDWATNHPSVMSRGPKAT